MGEEEGWGGVGVWMEWWCGGRVELLVKNRSSTFEVASIKVLQCSIGEQSSNRS